MLNERGHHMDITKILLNPVRMRIIQYLLLNAETTVNSIIEQIDDVPRTTLYRHLKVLEDNNLITVVKENRIRGTLEKVYSINKNVAFDQSPSEAADSFFLGLLSDFRKYFQNEHANPQVDMLMFRTATLLMTDDEFVEFITEIGDVIKKRLNNKMTEGRKLRKISTISSPNID